MWQNGRRCRQKPLLRQTIRQPPKKSSWVKCCTWIRDIPGYKPYFEKAFGTDNPMTVENAVKAVAAYERTLITPNSAYDRYVKGDKKVLSEQQVRGMNRFASVGCVSCHSGAAFNGPAMAPATGFFMKFPTYTDSFTM